MSPDRSGYCPIHNLYLVVVQGTGLSSAFVLLARTIAPAVGVAPAARRAAACATGRTPAVSRSVSSRRTSSASSQLAVISQARVAATRLLRSCYVSRALTLDPPAARCDGRADHACGVYSPPVRLLLRHESRYSVPVRVPVPIAALTEATRGCAKTSR